MKDPQSETIAPFADVRVYNRSTRQTIEHAPHKASPSSFVNVPQDVADRWMRLFPGIIVEAGIAQKELGGVTAELAEARKALAAANARLQELDGAKAAPAKVKIKPDASEML